MFLLPLISLAFGGGGNKTVSKNTFEVLNSTINDISSKITNICDAKAHNTQALKINIGNVTGCSNIDISKIGQSITSNISTDCKMKTMTTVDLQTLLKNNFDQHAESKQSGMFPGFANEVNAENKTTLTNLITNTNEMGQINKSIAESINIQDNVISIKDIICTPTITKDMWGNETLHQDNFKISDINQYIVGQAVANGMLSSESFTTAMTDIDNKLAQKAKATLEGMDFNLLYYIIIAIVVVIVCGYIFKGTSASSTKSENSTNFENQDKVSTNYLIGASIFPVVSVIAFILSLGMCLQEYLLFSANSELMKTLNVRYLIYINVASGVTMIASVCLLCYLIIYKKTLENSNKYIFAAVILACISIAISLAILSLVIIETNGLKTQIRPYTEPVK